MFVTSVGRCSCNLDVLETTSSRVVLWASTSVLKRILQHVSINAGRVSVTRSVCAEEGVRLLWFVQQAGQKRSELQETVSAVLLSSNQALQGCNNFMLQISCLDQSEGDVDWLDCWACYSCLAEGQLCCTFLSAVKCSVSCSVQGTSPKRKRAQKYHHYLRTACVSQAEPCWWGVVAIKAGGSKVNAFVSRWVHAVNQRLARNASFLAMLNVRHGGYCELAVVTVPNNAKCRCCPPHLFKTCMFVL